MKLLVVIMVLVLIGCVTRTPINIEKGNTGARPTPVETVQLDSLPTCLQQLSTRYTQEVRMNPPRKIYSYRYRDSLVYYVTAPCCDFFSDLYNTRCELIAHPDGGITGKGDGRLPDFHSLKKVEKLLWEDKRPAGK